MRICVSQGRYRGVGTGESSDAIPPHSPPFGCRDGRKLCESVPEHCEITRAPGKFGALRIRAQWVTKELTGTGP